MSGHRASSFVGRHLDPGSRTGEILFGLIMTLTFTLGAGIMLQEEGRAGARDLLIATIGCNLAWGLIDGVFYVLQELFERGRLRKIALRINQSTSAEEARGLVAAEYDERFVGLTDVAQRSTLYDGIVERVRAAPPPYGLQRSDVFGGIASGWLVFASSFPAALPFFFIHEPHVALRVSNAILLVLLFVVGYRVAQATTMRPWLVGSSFVLGGMSLVAIAIALGG